MIKKRRLYIRNTVGWFAYDICFLKFNEIFIIAIYIYIIYSINNEYLIIGILIYLN